MHVVNRSKWIIREANNGDVDAMTDLDKICFSVPWSRHEFEKELTENPRALYLVSENENGDMTGYAGLWIIIDEGHITNVAVHPDYRREGLAHKLVETLLHRAKEKTGVRDFTLEVRVSNEAGINLYEGFGFTKSGIRKKYYSDNGEDAAIMWLREDEQEK